MTPQEQTLLSRVRPNSSHRQTVQNMFGLSGRLANERTRLKADNNLSDEGRRGQEAAFAKMLMRNFRELTVPLHRAQADVAAKGAGFKLPEIDKTDVVAEMRRAEIRTHVYSLPLADRMRAVESLDDTQLLAILDAPAMLSGLPEDRHSHFKSAYIDRQFGKQIRSLENDHEDNTVLESAATIVRRELQVASGLSDVDFLALEKSHEI